MQQSVSTSERKLRATWAQEVAVAAGLSYVLVAENVSICYFHAR